MSESKKLIPKRRFKGFMNTGEWTLLHRIGDYAEILTGGTPSTLIRDFWEPKEILWMSSGEVHRKRISYTDNMISKKGFENSSARWVKENSILIALAGQGKTRGTVAINELPITTNQSIASITPNKTLNSEFLFQNLDMRYEELRSISSGEGTRGGLNKKIISDINVISPCLKEQIQIGNFFKKIDKLIQTQRKKLQKVKTLKLAYLAEMFPCDGELKPKLRFKGFSDNWECKPLFTITNHRGGIAIERYFSSEGRYKVISIGSYGLDGQYIDQNIRVLANEKTNGLLVKKNELTMVLNDKTLNGSIIGRVLLIDENDTYVINQRTEIISPKDFFESRFAYVALNNNFREKVKKIVQGGTQIYVNYTFVENLYIEIPTINEQTKIGNFFKLLDSKIALEQKKLEKLNNIKQAYLNEMFV